jgi:hypothetical protein
VREAAREAADDELQLDLLNLLNAALVLHPATTVDTLAADGAVVAAVTRLAVRLL